MIINGSSRSNGAFFTRHLMRADHNERVAVVEMRGLAALTVRDAFREMEAIASGTKATNYFYHANLNPRENEQLTPEQWQQAADVLEERLHLTGQPRFIVEHEKDGRTHRHIVWSRIDADSMTAISDSLTYQKHEAAARAIEEAFGHEPVDSVLVKGRKTPRPDRNVQDWESFRGQATQRDPKDIKREVTALWQAADSGTAFAAALAEHGYILTRGDRRDFCIIDAAGDEHSLARRIDGVKAADIRARMADVDREALPTVAEGRALARDRQDASGDAAAPVTEEPLPDTAPDAPKDSATAQPTGGGQGREGQVAQDAVTVPNDPVTTSQPVETPPAAERPATVAPAAVAPRPSFADRAKRAFASLFGKHTEPATVPSKEPDTLPPIGPMPAKGEQALAAFFASPDAPRSDTASRDTPPPASSPLLPQIVPPSAPDAAAPVVLSQTDDPHADLVAKLRSSALSIHTAVREDPSSPLDAVHQQAVAAAVADRQARVMEETARPGGRFERIVSWWGSLRERYDDWRGQLQERFQQMREPEQPDRSTPTHEPER